MTDKQTLGDEAIQAEYAEDMKALARYLHEIFNGLDVPVSQARTGFVLMVFPMGEGKNQRCNYISNANRKDVTVMLREQLAYFEGMPRGEGRA